jgi:hypothetical protein
VPVLVCYPRDLVSSREYRSLEAVLLPPLCSPETQQRRASTGKPRKSHAPLFFLGLLAALSLAPDPTKNKDNLARPIARGDRGGRGLGALNGPNGRSKQELLSIRLRSLLNSPSVLRTMNARRLPPPSSVKELDACFVVTDSAGQKFAYVYYEEELGRRSAAKLLRQRSGAPPDRCKYCQAAGAATQIKRGPDA